MCAGCTLFEFACGPQYTLFDNTLERADRGEFFISKTVTDLFDKLLLLLLLFLLLLLLNEYKGVYLKTCCMTNIRITKTNTSYTNANKRTSTRHAHIHSPQFDTVCAFSKAVCMYNHNHYHYVQNMFTRMHL